MDYRKQLQEIKIRFMVGEISYAKSIELSSPIINKMNQKARAQAKKYGKKHRDFTYGYLMR